MSEALAEGEVGSVSIPSEPKTEDNEPRSAQQLPQPKGYKLLIALSDSRLALCVKRVIGF